MKRIDKNYKTMSVTFVLDDKGISKTIVWAAGRATNKKKKDIKEWEEIIKDFKKKLKEKR